MKKLQKMFAMLLAISMIMSVLSVNAFAAEKTSAIQIVEDGGKVYYLSDPVDATWPARRTSTSGPARPLLERRMKMSSK